MTSRKTLHNTRSDNRGDDHQPSAHSTLTPPQQTITYDSFDVKVGRHRPTHAPALRRLGPNYDGASRAVHVRLVLIRVFCEIKSHRIRVLTRKDGHGLRALCGRRAHDPQCDLACGVLKNPLSRTHLGLLQELVSRAYSRGPRKSRRGAREGPPPASP